MKNQKPVLSLADLERRWIAIDGVRREIAAEIDLMSKELPGEAGRQLRLVRDWFVSSSGLNDAIRRPDVFAFCLPLLKSEQQEISTSDVTQAVRIGLGSLIQNASSGRRWFRILIYPVLLIVAAMLLAFGFSFWIAPEFEAMFDEFGIELPGLTRLVFAWSSFTRHWGWLLVAFLVGPGLLFWMFD